MGPESIQAEKERQAGRTKVESLTFITASKIERKVRDSASPILRFLWLNVGGVDIHCLAAGNRGEPIVILHGGGLDAGGLSFRKTIPVLAGRQVWSKRSNAA
jgi:hypothetical protein